MKRYTLEPGALPLHTLETFHAFPDLALQIAPESYEKVTNSQAVLMAHLKSGARIYGITTGCGALYDQTIAPEELGTLQENLIVSHACGTGPALSEEVVRLVLLLKINALSQGYSGVSVDLLAKTLLQLFNKAVYPIVPAKGSVGASGDLAPLAHLALVLIGKGPATHQGRHLTPEAALKQAKLKPYQLAPKEGLSLINGIEVSTALTLHALFRLKALFEAALVIGALSSCAEGANGSAFDPQVHQVRRQVEQMEVASYLNELLSPFAPAHRLQDPYSIRCQPQVMGALLQQLRFAATTLTQAANAVTDNPLVFTETQQVLSGGNFHAEAIALTADTLANVIAEIGSISERRTALMMTSDRTPQFLVAPQHTHSGLMLTQVTAAALVSENKQRCMPASVDSIPTSGQQEDHVSMATHAAYRLQEMLENLSTILAIEWMAAGESIALTQTTPPPKLKASLTLLREQVPTHQKSVRVLAGDLQVLKEALQDHRLDLRTLGLNGIEL